MLASILEASLGDVEQNVDVANVALRSYVDRPIFAPSNELIHPDNPFRRPLLNDDFGDWDSEKRLSLKELTTNHSLIANRLLLSIYEQDFVFLPRTRMSEKAVDFASFYDREGRVLGELLSCRLESQLFDCVSDAVHVSGVWDGEAFIEYFEHFKQNLTCQRHGELMQFITAMQDPVAGAKMYLVQLAGDFLVESSAMARNVVGNYGPIQSELFKVVIDECGYGVYETKHSTLFERVLQSQGMESVPHAYWQLYLPTSMYLNNYYNFICRDHSKVFRYLGGILQVETAFRITCKQMSEMATTVFGPNAQIKYFQEHTHIDDHHSRMVMEKIVLPAIEQYGPQAAQEIVRGFEESLVVGDQFVSGARRQLEWIDDVDRGQAVASPLPGDNVVMRREAEVRFCGTSMTDSVTSYEVLAGALELHFGCQKSVRLDRGQAMQIPAGVLHGVRTLEPSEFSVQRPEREDGE